MNLTFNYYSKAHRSRSKREDGKIVLGKTESNVIHIKIMKQNNTEAKWDDGTAFKLGWKLNSG